jgi:hypothetical protein
MNITPKHKVNDIVYFMSSDKIQKSIVNKIDVAITETDTIFYYNVEDSDHYLYEHKAFKTIDELIDSLKQKHIQEYDSI